MIPYLHGTHIRNETHQINLLQIFFHFVGSIFLSWVITERWNYTALWPIIAACNLPTALLELGVLIFVYGLKIYRP
jgi:hypothetical protein